ncbi:transcriptional repressor LexA [Pseudofulvimonas gallinarii]|jgi:repressor LexA|uniref:LexA repressor n=1 Tax=Pseudofulvimonas gallinarii TaxID=634155 RepID=A0A4V2UW76_9GAMM|nr:transcriptional repressor LexA [Pseudofulvimonas gallinarii]TCS98567.1 SOS-response transcriptional repressor LexA [Pseudofulvimonas gallinarii]THD12969.1 repressor LexA [Pseudofulvimonas gallinarii]
MSISETQQRILRLIAERIESEGMPPSQTEIARELGFKGVRAAQHHLEALQRAGAIERIPGRARGIRLLQPVPAAQPDLPLASDAADWVPLVGRVSAGLPIGTDIDYDNRLLLDRSLFSPFPDYLLRVEGESMRDEGILDGDLIGVHRTAQARNGQIVVARIDEEITVKQLQVGRDGLRLLPRNDAFAPIEIAAGQDFAIEGLYCGLLRPHR